jgi:hypothetical protein
MVKKILKYFLYIFLFFIAFVYFIPKTNLYYLMEKYLVKYDVVISNEKLQEKFFDLNIKNMDISVKGIDSAKIENGDITLSLLYNKVDLKKIKLSSVMQNFFPVNIEHIYVVYTIFNPLNITGEAKGDFGEAKIKVSLLNRKAILILHPSKLMLRKYRTVLRELKKLKNGEYKYEESF